MTRGGPAAFDPTQIAGLGGWWDPSDTASITSSSGAVSQLNDKSGNARHLVQATAGKKPITGTRTINSLNVLDFDGTDDALASSAFTQAQPVTEFVVVAVDATSVSLRGLFGTDGSSSPGLYITASGHWEYYAGALVDFGVAADTNPHVISGIFSGASSVGYVDNVQATTSSPGTGGFGSAYMGNDGFGQPADGRIGEMLFYASALSSTDRNTVAGYLKAKWGTP